ncbi:MAG TPA: vWA domain-containing protein, partial [Herpetosiphonaceae bacterium]|nr:vWA domain-containing protein [Herpetosiphonaceae bacterium]
MRKLRSLVSLFVLIALMVGTLTLAPPPAVAQSLDPQHADCATPANATVRGKAVQFDQCLDRDFNHGGNDYRIHVYYTEANSATNTNQCTATENTNGRCEHALANGDDGSGNNLNAVAMAAEAEQAYRFYIDRNLSFVGAGNDEMNVYIAEDPRTGGVIYPNSIYVDDDYIDNNDLLRKRLLAFHEGQHLVQDKYDNGGIGWNDFYGEGISRAIEDRAEAALDADTGHLFIPEVNGILGSDSQRASDLSTINYRSVLWWTWLMDQYTLGGEVAPIQGWSALRDFYTELNSESNQLKAIRDFIGSKGSSFEQDFIDYTLALYAYRFSPADPRLRFLDAEVTATGGLSGHTVINSAPAFGTVSQAMNPRSSRYWEFNPASQCDFVAFSFDGNGKTYGFSVMTVDGGALQKRWTSKSGSWSRTVRSQDLDRVVGVVSALDDAGTVDVGRGCVTPTLSIKNPTSAAFEMVGLPANPRMFIVRLAVKGADGGGVAGLTAGDFAVQLRPAGGGASIPATIVNSTYVQDDYWLLVQAPNAAAGAVGGAFYDLTVALGSQSDTENSAVLYVERTQDVMIVLDRSGSMGGSTGRIEAARNAANLLVNELSDNDQGGYVAFDTDATLRSGLAPVGSGPGSHRADLQAKIAAEVPLDFTSIGDGLNTAADEEDANGVKENLCSFVLLSDGHENEPDYWADVDDKVIDNGCAIHSIGLGPGANEVLLQQIAASVPGGSYDYADVSGNVPMRQAPAAVDALVGWQNNLSRIYDFKAAQVAGRQRIFSVPGTGRQTDQCENHTFFVDDSSADLLVAVAWQNDTKNTQQIELFD